MMYFNVEKEVLAGARMVGLCGADGTALESFNKAEDLEFTLGFTVHIWNDEESFEDEWYPVKTDTSTDAYRNDEEEVIKKIKEDHPAGEWECFNW